MALRQRKDTQAFVPNLTLYDFLPVYLYRGSDGRRDVFVNWPVVFALAIGFGAGRL